MTQLVVGASKRRELYYAAQGGLIAMLGAVRLVTGPPVSLSLAGFLPVLMVAAGCVLIVMFLVRYVRASDALVFNDDGLVIFRPPIGLVSWLRIAAVRSDRVRGRQFLHIRLDDPQLQAAANPASLRWIAGDELWFDASGIDMDVDEIIDAVTPRLTAKG